MKQNNKLMHAKTLAFGVLFLFTCFFTTYSFAQTGNQAKQILDKTASVLSRKGSQCQFPTVKCKDGTGKWHHCYQR